AGDDQQFPGDEVGVLRSQEQCSARDLVGHTPAPQRGLGQDPPLDLRIGASIISVLIHPGQIALTVMCGPSARAIALVRPFIPALETTYSVKRIAEGWYSPEFEDMLMILPVFCSSMMGTTSFEQRYAPLRLTSIVRSQSSSVVSMTDLDTITPALLTRMSTRPKASTVARTSLRTSADLETSPCTDNASPPWFLIASTTSRASRSPLTQLTATFAP